MLEKFAVALMLALLNWWASRRDLQQGHQAQVDLAVQNNILKALGWELAVVQSPTGGSTLLVSPSAKGITLLAPGTPAPGPGGAAAGNGVHHDQGRTG